MLIRDDRDCDSWKDRTPVVPGRGHAVANQAWTDAGRRHRDPDRVLFDCPTCARSHFVTVDGCPSEAEAAAETAMVDAKRAA